MKKTAITIGLAFISILFIQSCEKDKIETKDSDVDLFNKVIQGGYIYYQGGAILNPASPSPHGNFKLRFNATAFAALDTSGELPAGNSFPTGSVLVKELYNGGTLTQYAVINKDPANPNAGSGWVWAEFNTSGTAVFSTANKGDGCISCHSGSPARDLVKTFDLH